MSTIPPNERPRRDDLSAPSTAPQTESERRYRTLFGAMEEGFCVVELVFDEDARPVDYHFLEFNAAFERMTGISAASALGGKSVRELYPTLEEFWFETYGRVATTGEPVRFENRAEAMGKWFEVHAFRIGGQGSPEVGILFKDVSERRRADLERERLLKEVREREAFLELVTDRLPVRVGYIDRDYRYRFLNGAYERAFDLPPGTGVGLTVAELAGEPAFEIAKGFLDRAFAGEARTEEFSVPYKFGERRVEVQYVPDFDDAGGVRGAVVHVLDVTQRREDELLLARVRDRQDKTLEAAQVATFDWDVPNDLMYGNSLLDRFFGIAAAEGEGVPVARCFESIHPDDRATVESVLQGSMRRGDRYEIQYRVSGEGGRERWVLTRGETTNDAAGVPLRVSGVVLDVTERVYTEEALRESESRRAMALDSGSIGSWSIDLRSLELTSDARFRAVFGGVDEAFGYREAFDIIHPEDRERVRRSVEAASRPVDPIPYSAEYRVIHPDGSIHWLSAVGRANFRADDDGSPAESLDGTVIDITDRRRAEEERERLIAALEIERTRLQTFFQLAPAFIAVLRGRDLVFEYVNDAYYGIVGHRTLLGLPLVQAIPEAVGGGEGRDYDRLLLEIMDSGEACTYTERPVMLQRTPGGAVEERFIDLAYQPLREADGAVSGVLVHGIDVTEGVLARRRVEESEARYRTLFTTMSEGYCVAEIVFAPDGAPVDYRFVEVNDAFERLTGIPLGAARSGRTILELVPGIEPFFIELYARVARTGVAEEYSRFATALGRWFEGQVVPFGESGSHRVAVLFNEVTDRKRAEIERERLLDDLAIEREKLDTILNLSPSFVTILRGEDLIFEYANPAYKKAVGRSDLVGRKLADALPEVVSGGSAGQEYDRFLLDTMANGKTIAFKWQPIQLETSPGSLEERILDFTYQPLQDRDGKATGVLVHGTDVTDRARAERELAEREELFRTVFEQAPDDAIIVMEADRTVTAWNPAAERICGWLADEAIGQLADIIFTPEERKARAPAAETMVAARLGKADDERWHLRKDGSRFWGSGTMNALHDAEGKVRGYLKVFRDATERYEETQTLAFLSLLTEAVIDERDADRIVETAERMLGQYLGASRVAFAEASSDGESVTIHREWAPDLPSLIGTHELARFGPTVVQEFRAGRTHVSLDAIHESNGAPELEVVKAFEIGSGVSVPTLVEGRLASVVIVHDRVPREWTTDEIALIRQVADRMSAEIERTRAEGALRTSEERFRQLVDLSPATVWFGEPDGGLSYISQDFYDATGMSPETALPVGWATVVHPDDLPHVVEEWAAARAHETRYDTEFRIQHLGGEYRWISARALPVRDADGKVTGWLGSNSDIHERKTSEQTLQARVDERTEQLQAAVREAEGFNYSISHDLRTPLRAMVSTSGILLEEAGPELNAEHRALLVRQSENAVRLGRLIDELLRLSRLSRVPVNREPLDLTRKVWSVVEEMRQSGTFERCRFDVQPGMTAEGDPGLIRTVLQNLVDNACKFSPEGGTVRVRQDEGTLSVSDEGVGFDMQFAHKLFLPFERLVADTEFPGTGIGLANVKRIVERHGGKVWAESAPGKGATFFFTLS